MAVSGSGRPFRFLGSLMALWVGMRIFQLWPVEGTLSEALAPPVQTRGGALSVAAPGDSGGTDGLAPLAAIEPALRRADQKRRRAAREGGAAALRVTAGSQGGAEIATIDRPGRLAMMPDQRQAVARAMLASQASLPIPGVPLSTAPAESRLRGSAWLIARGGQTAPFVPQLGGSQAGVRLTYAIVPAARLAVAGRLSTALRGRQREAAIGLDWQPTRLPVHVIAEQRIGIEQARGGPSIGLVGGFGPTAIAGGLMLDGYGQAGVIARDGAEGYADGAVRVSRVVATVDAVRLELGLGAWGGAQRGAARLDAGPSASAVLPVAGVNLRLSLEWRERLAGRAAPASGPAVSIGTDF